MTTALAKENATDGPVTLNRAQRRHPDTYAAEQFATKLGVSTWTLYQSVKNGDCPVPPIKVGRRLVWPKGPVDRLLGIDPQ